MTSPAVAAPAEEVVATGMAAGRSSPSRVMCTGDSSTLAPGKTSIESTESEFLLLIGTPEMCYVLADEMPSVVLVLSAWVADLFLPEREEEEEEEERRVSQR